MRNSEVKEVLELLLKMESIKDRELALKIIEVLEPDVPLRYDWWTTIKSGDYPTVTWTGGDTTTTTGTSNAKYTFQDASTRDLNGK